MSPHLRLVFQPRTSIREIVDTDPGYLVLWGALGIGFAFNITQIFLRYGFIKEYQSFQEIMKGCLWAGLITGYCLVYFFQGILLWWIGKKLGGSGTVREVRAGLVWSYLPTLLAGFLTLVVCLNLGFETLKPPDREAQREAHTIQTTAVDWSGLRGFQPVYVLTSRNCLSSDGLKLPLREPVNSTSPLYWCTVALAIGGVWSTLLLIGTLSETMRLSLPKAVLVLALVSLLCVFTFIVAVGFPKFGLFIWLGFVYWYWDKDEDSK